jgi:hypothetical protein
MSGREAGHGRPSHESLMAESSIMLDPDSLEVAPGTVHEKLEGSVPSLAGEEELRVALENAFDYRGDVQITRKNGDKVEGYVFDRSGGKSLQDSFVRVLPKDGSPKMKISYDEIAALAFSGRDMAAGKSWEAWVRNYWERKAAGEKDISIQPESLE